MTPQERKASVAILRKEHQPYFDKNNKNALYIPKMAYRPSGKDDLHISFFPSELQKSKDIFTEFVSIDYETEDPKRTLYLLKYNADWAKNYEIVTSNSGFERHIVPVSELLIMNEMLNWTTIEDASRFLENQLKNVNKVKDPEKRDVVDVLIGIEKALLSINQKLSKWKKKRNYIH